MELVYASDKVMSQCTDLKAAKKLLSGDAFFSIDVKSIADPWRIILQPLDNDKQPFDPCNIDEIAQTVKIIGIIEVSKHYE